MIDIFSKKDMQMADKPMKRYSPSLVTSDMHIKTTMRYHFTTTRMAIIKRRKIDISEDVGKLEFSYFAGRNVS